MTVEELSRQLQRLDEEGHGALPVVMPEGRDWIYLGVGVSKLSEHGGEIKNGPMLRSFSSGGAVELVSE